MDRTEVGVFKEPDHVRFRGFLERQDCRGLETQIVLVLRGDLSHEPLEGQLADQQICTLLILSDFSERDCPGFVPVRLLDATRYRRLRGADLKWGRFPCSLIG